MKSRENEYYDAMLKRDATYIGLFFVGIKTTGIFCHAICPARKPKIENCEFFATAKDALSSGYRPCKRCQPLSNPSKLPDKIKALLNAVEAAPDKRWKEWDFKQLGLDSSTARRQFKQHFQMTFVEYARLRRMSMAMKEIKEGKAVIEGQLTAGYTSASGFRNGFSKLFGDAPSSAGSLSHLHCKWLETPLGAMLAISDDEALILLEFTERRALDSEIRKLRERYQIPILPSEHPILTQITQEIEQYFNGDLQQFKTAIKWFGSQFQRAVWRELQNISYAETISYKTLAERLAKPTAYRAVANANGKNQLAIIVPCHRVINTGGGLGGYGAGRARKQRLINLEKQAR